MNALAPRYDQPRSSSRALAVVPRAEQGFASWAPAALPAPREMRFSIPSVIGAAAAVAMASALVPHLLG